MKTFVFACLSFLIAGCCLSHTVESRTLTVYEVPSTAIFAVGPAPSATDVKNCADCPRGKPCGYSTKAGCNTCSGTTYCVDGKWYSQGTVSCTTAWCGEYPMISDLLDGGDGHEHRVLY